MLAGKGFKKVFNVSGGIKAWHGKTAIGPQTLGIYLFDGKEEPVDVLKTAYSLEQGLRAFYLDLGYKTENIKIKELFDKLAEIEIKHQQSIYKAFLDISTEKKDLDEFEATVEAKALEGGLSNKEYMDLFKPDLNSEVDVISLAMSIEAQALDLYQRVIPEMTDKDSTDIVQKIANEEKTHLASLGELLDNILKGNL